MFNIKNLFLRALLALSIAVGAPAALAGPVYHVSLDTSSLAGSTGFLDLGFLGLETPNPTFARLNNFSGDFFGAPILEGDAVGDVASGVVLGNRTGFNYFDQAVRFGGLLSFDVSFETEYELIGTTLSVALLDSDFLNYLGAEAHLLTIDVMANTPAVIDVLAPGLVSVAEVPEPGDWLLLATGLFLLAATRRLQQRR
ncbi:NF038129 family PEP-CTERM protein [Massilia sp.]|uniref:NF038129 family PEP-CTERM protein n=1 Tax=Massilia sp. TaxID=1882437 RepID=UPI002899E107|nr:NF038129 family PEP-CTERM protein [Massilia sp.]